ncbi:hypothetical protein MCHIJ_36410 [Mycolicibacterium chitae]|uniref:Uncharacterized protein n=1 Tax=Mycolicibacterium chitae TaxID=1792 RepID=A0A448I691_MYCCI|nr:hypothetical protein [Mycolicibacterium chitae]MCV7104997.1 hypothetical protein [Mycolicibacterium chitae]BBZ04204.1 hypothetical protein MCHIJ_36410 [Mycolicibacterium chitae]VEG47853.1 Uncharacterised protein [Mycolicibacterium chitae]
MRQLAGYRHQRSEINMSQHLPRRPSFVRTTHRLTKVYGLMAGRSDDEGRLYQRMHRGFD